MRKWICLLLCLWLLVGGVSAEYEADESTASYAACAEIAAGMDASHILVYNYTEDTLVYSRTLPGEKLYPASITKLFSTYVALRIMEPDEVVTVGSELDLVLPGSSIAFLAKKQQLTVTQLVEGMLLPSGNDAALVLSAAAGRKLTNDPELSDQDAVDAFVAEMNRQAKELGFERTHFINPDGYHSGSHFTCVSDLIRISRLALEDATISNTMNQYEIEETFVSGQSIKWTNTNQLLQPKEPYYNPNAIGMKTGHTGQAGNCLMSAFRMGGKIYVVGILGSNEVKSRFVDAVRLAEACRTT